MDAHVGEILDAIDDLNIRDNTIVVFTSDNGPEATWPWQGSSGPWRGYYFTHMEGSLRVPFIIRWPGHIPAERGCGWSPQVTSGPVRERLLESAHRGHVRFG